MRFCTFLFLAAVGIVVASGPLKAQTASFNFAQLDVPNSASTEADGINTRGDIVGFFVDSANKTHGFLFRKGEFTTIDFPGADVVSTQARGINPQGDIVGFYVSKDAAGVSHTHGFVATRHTDEDVEK